MITNEINNYINKNSRFIIHLFFEIINNNVVKIINFDLKNNADLKFTTVKEYIFRDLYFKKEDTDVNFFKIKRLLKNADNNMILEEIISEKIDSKNFPFLKDYHKINNYEICKKKIIDNVNLIIKKKNNKIKYELELNFINNISDNNIKKINKFINDLSN